MNRIKAIFSYILLAIFSLSLTCCEQKGDPYVITWDGFPEIENGELKSIYIIEYKMPHELDRKIELDWWNYLSKRIVITPSKYVWEVAFRFDYVVSNNGHEEIVSYYTRDFNLLGHRFKDGVIPIKINKEMKIHTLNPKGLDFEIK